MLEDSQGRLSFRVRPNWRSAVNAEDVHYFQSILKDFEARSRLHPAELFAQISNLAVGPLVTHAVGQDLADAPGLHELAQTFVAP